METAAADAPPHKNERAVARMEEARGRRPTLQVEVVTESGGGRAPGLSRWLAHIAPVRKGRHSVTVALVTNRRMRALNRTFRGKDRVTDVLSFPAGADLLVRALSPQPISSVPDKFLGDIVIATGVAREQARRFGHSYQTELRVLSLHGLLHLLGYEHNGGGLRMTRLEAKLLQRSGAQKGLLGRIPRAVRPGRLPR